MKNNIVRIKFLLSIPYKMKCFKSRPKPVVCMSTPLAFLDGSTRAWSPESIIELADTLNLYHTIYLANVSGMLLTPMFARLATNDTVVSLRLDGCALETDDMRLLSTALRTNVTLHILSLDHCNLQDAGAQLLSETMDYKLALRKLFLYDNNIGNVGARALSKWIAKNSTLEVLDLSENNIGDDGMESLAKVIRYNKTLQVLYVNNNLFGSSGLDAFTDALAGNRCLRAYYAACNTVGDMAATRFARMLRHNPHLTSVSFAKTNIGDTAVQALVECGGNLTLLDVSDNNITNKGGLELQKLTHTSCFVQGNKMADALVWYEEIFFGQRETDV